MLGREDGGGACPRIAQPALQAKRFLIGDREIEIELGGCRVRELYSGTLFTIVSPLARKGDESLAHSFTNKRHRNSMVMLETTVFRAKSIGTK